MTHIRLFAAMLALLFAAIVPAGARSPAFRVDPYWPKPLPNNWILGQVGGMAMDGTNNVLETVRRSDGAVVRTFGRPGRESGEFHWVHVGKFDSRDNFYTGEVDTGKRLQKWVPVE
jgi:hypothetical protein